MNVIISVTLGAVMATLLPAEGAGATDATASFLARHWARPLPPQGEAPAAYSALERSLDPAACGACHPQQYADWRETWHSRAMGAGVLGQLLGYAPEDREGHQDCLRCHAPLHEQAEALIGELRDGRGAGAHRDGLTCAGCHLRAGRVYGPPRRGSGGDTNTGPHGGFEAAAAFEDSRFCAACHQFEADGYALNGKPLENTWAEWAASRYARDSVTCQSCHMPDRRHRWRGVHDPETVRGGVTVEAPPPRLAGDVIWATLTLRNSATGHYLPTYVTPRLVLAIWQEDAVGRPLAGTRREHVVARQVTPDLSAEIADTRLAPDAEARLRYAVPRHNEARALVTNIRVEPDAFYVELYRAWLADGAGRGTALLRQALEAAETSAFDLHRTRSPL